MSESNPVEAAPPAVWQAAESVDSGWPAPVAAPPAPEPETRRRPRSRWVWLGPLLAVVVVVALVIGFGGLDERHDFLTTVPVGATMSTGAFDYTFTRATAQQQDDLDRRVYKVIVYGTAQNTTDTGRGPSADQFAGRDVVDPDAESPSGLKTGASADYTVGGSLNPGLPPVAFQVEFEFPPAWKPTGTFRIAAAKMTEQQYFLNEKQPNWQNDDTGFQVYLPIETLAPKKS